MSRILRVGGGYSRKCSQCEFNIKECQRVKEELKSVKDEIDVLIEKKEHLEDQIKMMIEDKAIEDLNIFSKLEQITNMVERSVLTKVNGDV